MEELRLVKKFRHEMTQQEFDERLHFSTDFGGWVLKGRIHSGCWHCNRDPYEASEFSPHYCIRCIRLCDECMTPKVLAAFNWGKDGEHKTTCHVCEMKILKAKRAEKKEEDEAQAQGIVEILKKAGLIKAEG
jgi:hypothetical protein